MLKFIWCNHGFRSADAQLSNAMDKVCINFGLKILDIIPGRVSTEVDARSVSTSRHINGKCVGGGGGWGGASI